MKKSIIITIILFSILELNAQIERIDHYVAGTKVSYFPEQCGNDISEAEGKLTFCDEANNLGVVDASLGLNTRQIHRMIPNYLNDDLAFVTQSGISIQKEDGSWDNIPNRVISSQIGSPSTNMGVMRDAIIMPNGTMAYLGGNSGSKLDIYNLETKSIEGIPLNSTQHYPQAICYDSDRNVAWLSARQSNTNFLYKLEDGVLTLEYELDDWTSSNVYQNDLWQYRNNRILKASINGLTVIEIDDVTGYTETQYDNLNTAILPYNECRDMEIDNEGIVWLLQVGDGNSEAGVVRFNVEEETYDLYTQPFPGDPDFNISFNKIGLDRNSGVLWLVSNSYSGFFTLEFDGETPVWNQIPNEDFDALGVPYIYNVNFIHSQGNKTFFCTSSNSTSSNQNYEVLVLEEGEWTGINDDEPGNISSRMVRRFNGSYADDNGGVWFINYFDDDLTYMVDETSFMHFPEFEIFSNNIACVNQNQNLVLRTVDGFGEFVPPNLIPFAESSSLGAPVKIAPWSNEIWALHASISQYLVRYIDGEIIQEYEFEEYFNSYHFAMTTDRKAVLAKGVGATVDIKVFDTYTEEMLELTYPEYIGDVKEIVPAEDGKFWIIGWYGMLFYNGLDFEYYDDENLGLAFIFGNNAFSGVALDQEQNLHFLLSGGYLYTIAPPYNNMELVNDIKINGSTGIMPVFTATSGFGTLALDSDGDLWTSGSNSILEIQGLTDSGEFNPNDIVGVEELSKNNIDFEMFPNPNNTGQLRIILPENSEQSTMSIFDMQGKLIEQYAIQRSNPVIDLKNITAGVYMVNISNEDYSISKKLIVR